MLNDVKLNYYRAGKFKLQNFRKNEPITIKYLTVKKSTKFTLCPKKTSIKLSLIQLSNSQKLPICI